MKPKFFGGKNKTAAPAETGSSAEDQNSDNYSSLSAADLLKKINAGEKINLIDMRNAEDFAKEHIIDSKNYSAQDIAANFSTMDKNKKYILIDGLGLTPQEIEMLKFLSDNGFPDIAYLEGGFSGWKNNYNPTINSGDPYSFSDQSKVSYIKSDDLKEIIAEESNLYILDVRKKGQFDEGHIAGAVNIFLDELESRRKEIPFGKKIILCDNDGMWAFQGAVRLFDMGIMNVYALSDGLDVWKQKGFEIVK